MRKKKWKNPKLMILLRGKPEEAVLTGCKGVSVGAGATGHYYNCGTWSSFGFCGGWCSANAPS